MASEQSTRQAGLLISDLAPAYNRWKLRALFAFMGFYLFVYLGRFALWPAAPIIRADLNFSHVEIGVINAALLWGFGAGDLVHGRLAEAYGLRLWVLLGAVLTTVLSVATSFATSLWTFAIPWGLAGFVNAAVWAPGVSLITQWWPRNQRGRAIGLVGVAAGGAMLVMWLVTGWVAAEWGWRAAFRYPPLLIAVAGVVYFLLVRDRPSDVGLQPYEEEPDSYTARAEAIPADQLRGFGPYRTLLTNWRFLAASHVKGLENVVRYGLTTWVPLYYFEEGGLSIESTILVTVALPIGYLTAPIVSGYISDRYMGSQRRPMIMASAFLSAAVLVALAFAPADNEFLGAGLLLAGGFAMSLTMIQAMAVDIGGRHMAGTASGLLDAHGYAYAGAQALIFSVILDASGSPWEIVFLAMAATRLVSAGIIWLVRI
ncbi:MAG: MFS transporter [Chloroflexi bacterium]|nr:MFS transporter [Chloroflexota bacterium]MCH8816942.1 MFS transporter [Chloroflexota bacterium]